ncbi:hypothetical protein HMI56_001755 [Coelomomyces lativittatus]|nr:hypothetical protein HMI56_001755 [Coelomomyces lativittatus]
MSLLHSITFSGTNHHQRSILDLDTYLHLLEDPFIAFEYGEEVLQHFQTTKSLKKIEKNFFKLWEDVFVTLENLPSRKTTETGTHQQPIDIKLEEMESLITFHPRPSHQSIFNVQYQVLKVLHALFKSIRLQKKGPKKLYSTTLSNFLTTWIQVALPSFYSFIRTLVTLPLYLSTLGLTILMDVVKFSHLPDLSSTYLLMKNQWVPILVCYASLLFLYHSKIDLFNSSSFFFFFFFFCLFALGFAE